MKATPDVPPVLLEIVAELREVQAIADRAAEQKLRNAYDYAYAGDIIFDQFEGIRDELKDIVQRLEAVATELAAGPRRARE